MKMAAKTRGPTSFRPLHLAALAAFVTPSVRLADDLEGSGQQPQEHLRCERGRPHTCSGGAVFLLLPTMHEAAMRHPLLQARNETVKSIATIDCGRM
jgi:hypothetical protein